MKKVIPPAVGLVLALCFPLVTADPFILSLLIEAGVWAIAVMGFVAILRTGEFSLGQAAFMAIGGYASALVTINLGIPFWFGLVFAGIMAALVALALGVVVLRLGGIYFAIVTLVFGEIVRIVALNWQGLTRGATGLTPSAPGTIHIGSITIDFIASKVPFYYLIVLLVLVAAVVFWRTDRSRLGRIFRSIASNETLAEHMGIHLMKYKVIIFVIAGFFTGIAGAFFCHFTLFMGPTTFDVWDSIMILIMGIVGGTSSVVLGPIIGALVLSAGGAYLTSALMVGMKPLVYGIIVIVVVVLLPGGLVDLGRYISRAPRISSLQGVKRHKKRGN